MQGLRRLARKEPPDANSDLGYLPFTSTLYYCNSNFNRVLTAPWQMIVEAARELADTHADFASRIENDVILALRQFEVQNRDMQQMSTIQGNLAAMAKEYDQAQKRAGKLNQKGGRAAAGRAAGASDEVDNATQQWEVQAPYVFEQLQAVDEKRLNHLRDVLTQLETHEVDHIEKAKGQAEKCLNSLLSVDIADEVRTWSLRKAEGGRGTRSQTPIPPRTSSREERSEAPASVPRIGRRLSRNVSAVDSLAPPSTSFAANGRPRSEREPSVDEEKKKPRGLKRLGTVFNKRRQSMMPVFTRPIPSRNKSSRLGSSTDLAEESIPDLPTPQPPASDRRDLPSPNPIPTTTADGPFTASNQLPQAMTPQRERTNSEVALSESAPRLPDRPVPSSNNSATAPAPLPQIHTAQNESSPMTTVNESFATPPQSAATDPITAAQQEAAAAEPVSGYSSFDDSASTQQQNAFSLSIRNAPIAEESSVANTAAMADVATALRAQAPTPTRRAGTLRGRRDVRNTVFIPSDQAPVFENKVLAPATNNSLGPPPTLAPPAASPLAGSPALAQQTTSANTAPSLPPRPFSSSDDRTSSDNQSIRSGRSLASTVTGGGVPRHPDVHTPGLSSSIIETVNAIFESGKLMSGSVVGELALSHTPDPTSTIQAERETIRLDNFPILEKVAPNPAFIHDIGQSATDRKGEYNVDLQALSARPAVAFKYQLHVDASDPSVTINKHAPLSITPSWKCEANQTFVILHYALNSSFTGVASGDVVLHNVILALYLEGTKATQCQSKPTGTFAREKSMIYWRFDELKLSAATGPQRAIARFATESQAKPGRVETRWEMQSSVAREGALGVSRLDDKKEADPFGDEGGNAAGLWIGVHGPRKTVAGTYTGT